MGWHIWQQGNLENLGHAAIIFKLSVMQIGVNKNKVIQTTLNPIIQTLQAKGKMLVNMMP